MKLSVFSAIVIVLGGECFYSINADEFSIETTDWTGKWYAVMATGCNDGKDCNIFTNSEKPCQCISAFFLKLQEYGWYVYMNAVNNETSTLTVDVGSAGVAEEDAKIQGFIYSRASMPLSVVSELDYTITENVVGQKFFLRYRITIIGSSIEYNYMITEMSEIDENNQDKGEALQVIWCRNKTPGKETIWTQIVKHFQYLTLDIHKLKFINQLGCVYPTENQCNEMFFC